MNGQNRVFATSVDGTRIGAEVTGSGPILLAIHGGTADLTRWRTVAPLLERHFRVWAVDRRGRGLSGDAAAYDIEREAEDILALLDEAGPGAVVMAHSYGATCALAAAGRMQEVRALVLYEPAFETEGHVIVDEDTFAEVERLLAADDRDGALTLFFRAVIGLPDTMIDAMRPTPIWSARLAAAHTMPREGRAAQRFRIDERGLEQLPFPVLVLRGSDSPPWLRAAAGAAHHAVGRSALIELDGQAHLAMETAPDAFAGEVLRFVAEAPIPPQPARG